MSNVWDGYNDSYDANVRLIILRELEEETSKSLHDSMLLRTLKRFGIRRGPDYLAAQLKWLELDAGAIRCHRAGSVIVAQLTQAGALHLSRDVLILGVEAPGLPR